MFMVCINRVAIAFAILSPPIKYPVRESVWKLSKECCQATSNQCTCFLYKYMELVKKSSVKDLVHKSLQKERKQ
eukprot:156955-Amphidinium_carterae.1